MVEARCESRAVGPNVRNSEWVRR